MSTAKPAAWWELTIEVTPELLDDAAALLVDDGALGAQIEERCVRVSYPGTATEQDLVAAAVRVLGGLKIPIAPETLRLIRRDHADWAEKWKAHFQPLQLGRRIWIVPSWIDDFTPPKGALVISLDPGMAFGTGLHETTALCAEAIETWTDELSSDRRPASRLLDVGCGSGILSIAAAKLGITRITAIDNDPDAVSVTRDNVRHNGVWDFVHTTGQPVEDVGGPFDLVVANILASVLIPLAEPIARQVAPGGLLVLSGILAEQADEVEATYRAISDARGGGLRLVDHPQINDWVALVFSA